MKSVLATLHVRPSPQALGLAAGCLAAALPEPHRSACRLVDLFPDQGEETWLELLLAGEPQLIAFSLYSWNRTAVLALCRRLRQTRPEILLVGGGPEASTSAAAVLSEGALDGVILGEGEQTWAALINQLAAGDPPSAQAGLVWRAVEGDEPALAPAIPPAELASPWLHKTLVPEQDGGVLWETSRGCIYACAYCFDARGSHGVRQMPEERLRAELELFVRHQVGQVWILDSTFNSPPQRGKQLLRLLLEHAPHLHFHLEARAELLDAETVELLSRLPCSLQLGLQTTNPAALKNLHRSFDRERFEHACRLLNQQGVTFGIDLIYALPGDNHEHFVASLDFALEQRPNHLDIFPLAVLPGTELYARRAELKILSAQTPPYLVEKLPGYTPQQLRRSRELAEACDLFYNRGRAVGFFATLCETCNLSGSALLGAFAQWLREQVADLEQRLQHLQEWPLEELLQLQIKFAQQQLVCAGQGHLFPAFCDLIRFHFNYAETLFDAETPAATAPLPQDYATRQFRCADTIRLVDFNYEIQDLLDMEANGLDLEAFADLFRPVGSTALFMRREGMVACESLSDEFSLLLLNCQEANGIGHLVGDGPGTREMIELLNIAWEEGLLKAASAAAAGP